jgi:hypothetical protein
VEGKLEVTNPLLKAAASCHLLKGGVQDVLLGEPAEPLGGEGYFGGGFTGVKKYLAVPVFRDLASPDSGGVPGARRVAHRACARLFSVSILRTSLRMDASQRRLRLPTIVEMRNIVLCDGHDFWGWAADGLTSVVSLTCQSVIPRVGRCGGLGLWKLVIECPINYRLYKSRKFYTFLSFRKLENRVLIPFHPVLPSRVWPTSRLSVPCDRITRSAAPA